MVSPLALFESFRSSQDSPTPHHFEQVQFQTEFCPKRSSWAPRDRAYMRRPSLPSLEDISSHFQITSSSAAQTRPKVALPAFLTDRRHSSPSKKEGTNFRLNVHSRTQSRNESAAQLTGCWRGSLTKANVQALEHYKRYQNELLSGPTGFNRRIILCA